jgi:hypothetical protein
MPVTLEDIQSGRVKPSDVPEEELKALRREAIRAKVASGELDINSLPEKERAVVQSSFAASEDVGSMEVEQEFHPDISMYDRAIVKNFGGENQQAIAYLKSQYGDALDFDVLKDQIVAKRKDEKKWRTLDPSFSSQWYNPMEAVRDAADIGYDVLAGTAQGMAATGAGLAGAATTAGVGAIPSAMLASGATGTLFEAGRQGIGQALGVHEPEFNKTNMGIAGGLGFIAPGLFGPGATGKQIAKTAAAPTAGLLQKALNYGEKESADLAANALKAAKPDPADIALLTNSGKVSAEQAKAILQKSLDPFTGMEKEALTEYLTKSQKGVLSDPLKATAQFLTGAPKDAYSRMVKIVPPSVIEKLNKAGAKIDTARQYTQIQLAELLSSPSNLDILPTSVLSTMKNSINEARRKIGGMIETSVSMSDKTVDLTDHAKDLQTYIDDLKSQMPKDGSNAYLQEQIAAAEEVLNKFFMVEKTVNKLDDLGNVIGTQKIVEPDRNAPISRVFAVKNGIKDQLLDFNSAAKNPFTNKASSAVEGIAAKIHKDLTDTVYDNIDGDYLRSAYRKNESLASSLEQAFKNEKVASRTLGNIDNKPNATVKKSLREFDDLFGEDMMEMSEVYQTWKHFTDTGGASQFGRGSESHQTASNIGTAVGGAFGTAASLVLPSEYKAPVVGAGAMIGRVSVPWATRSGKMGGYAKTGSKIIDASKKVFGDATQTDLNTASQNAMRAGLEQPMLYGGQSFPSAWMLMKNRGEDRK